MEAPSMKNARLAVLTVLATGLLAAGCGDDSSSTPTAATTTQSTATETTPSTTTGRVDEAVASCKRRIDDQPTLSESLKDDLKSVCEKAGSGAKSAAEATREVCTKIVEATLPEGSTRDQALDACKSATGG
jgi:hypothetical protein